MAEEIFEEMFDDTTLDKVQEGDMKNLSSLVKDLNQITLNINEKEEELKAEKKKIEEFHYSDSMDVVKGIPTYIDDSYSFMSVQRNERGGIESIEWVKK